MLLNEYQQREMDRAVCLYGPHRDDLGFNVNDMDAQTWISRSTKNNRFIN